MRAEWKYVNKFGIHARMTEILKLTIEATKKQLEHERKKLQRIKYGS